MKKYNTIKQGLKEHYNETLHTAELTKTVLTRHGRVKVYEAITQEGNTYHVKSVDNEVLEMKIIKYNNKTEAE